MPLMPEVEKAKRITEQIEQPRQKRLSQEEYNHKSDKNAIRRQLKIEAITYFGVKICIMIPLMIIFQKLEGANVTLPEFSSIFGAMSVLYMMSFFRLPTHSLIPPRKKRIDFPNFLKTELRFMLLLVTAAFFSSFTVEPFYLAIFLAANFIVQTVLFAIWQKYNHRLISAYSLNRPLTGNKNIIIVGADKNGCKAADLILRYPDFDVTILGFVDFHKQGLWRYRDIPLLGDAEDLIDIIRGNQVDYLMMAAEPEDYHQTSELFKVVEKMGIDICVMPDIYEHTISSCETAQINGQSVLMYRAVKRSPIESVFKLVLDKLCGILGLIVTGPIILLSAVLIKLDSRGPVFFKQVRSGINGRLFNMYKLRTMVADADRKKDSLKHLNEMSGPVFKIKNDPRVTRVGRFLRKFSIDEFPQFYNILKGDMSMVGPRPPLPKEVADYRPEHRRKLSVQPGATCLWQVNGRNDVDFEEWMKLDLRYIDNWSLGEDTRLILKTFPAIIKGKGAS